jgi:hypothetical protein
VRDWREVEEEDVRPTKEQIEAAVERVAEIVGLFDEREFTGITINVHDVEALRILLAATAPPTDEELREEAAEFLRRKGLRYQPGDVRLYIAGARREGRQ